MNWDIVEGNWKEFKGRVKAQWGMLTDDRFEAIAGKREELEGRFQKARGIAREEARKRARHLEGINRH